MFYKVSEISEVPFDLLLMADPSRKHIVKCLAEGSCYVLSDNSNIIGSCIIKALSSDVLEITNIAVIESKQGQGLGKFIIDKICRQAEQQGYKSIRVATGNSSIGQLAFYQKVGFRITGVELDYFINNYEEVIYEYGILCRDLIKLVKKL